MCILGLGKCISVQMLETRNLAVGGDKLIWIVGMWTRTLRCWVGGKVIIHTNLLFKKNIYIFILNLSPPTRCGNKDTQLQWAHSMPRTWFLNFFLHQRESWLTLGLQQGKYKICLTRSEGRSPKADVGMQKQLSWKASPCTNLGCFEVLK